MPDSSRSTAVEQATIYNELERLSWQTITKTISSFYLTEYIDRRAEEDRVIMDTNGFNAKDNRPRKVYYLGIIRPNEGEGDELIKVTNLDSFSRFTKGSIGNTFTFLAKTISKGRKGGERICVRQSEYRGKMYSYTTFNGYTAILGTEEDYDDTAGQMVLSEVAREFDFKYKPQAIRTGQPGSFQLDKLEDLREKAEKKHSNPELALKRDLEETKQVLAKTIDSVLVRGERLEDLAAKSADLNVASRAFFKQSQAQNSCCVIM